MLNLISRQVNQGRLFCTPVTRFCDKPILCRPRLTPLEMLTSLTGGEAASDRGAVCINAIPIRSYGICTVEPFILGSIRANVKRLNGTFRVDKSGVVPRPLRHNARSDIHFQNEHSFACWCIHITNNKAPSTDKFFMLRQVTDGNHSVHYFVKVERALLQ